MLLVVALTGANELAYQEHQNADERNKIRLLVAFILTVLVVQIGQGISWVVLTCKMTEKYWEKIHYGKEGYNRV